MYLFCSFLPSSFFVPTMHFTNRTKGVETMEANESRATASRVIQTLGPARHECRLGGAFKVRVADDLRRCVVFFGYPDATPGKTSF